MSVKNGTVGADRPLRRITRGRQSADQLKLSYDRKVSPLGLPQHSRRRMIPKVANSFGLPTKVTCPGMTPFCDSCYAVGSEYGSGVRALLEHNFSLLKKASSVDAMALLLIYMVALSYEDALAQGVERSEFIFRIHWSGDFYSHDYARAWAIAIKHFSHIQFWAYTRSFVAPVDVVPILAHLDNLALYLSADQWNLAAARRVAATHPVEIAYCAEDYQTARQWAGSPAGAWPARGDRAIPCHVCGADAIAMLDVPADRTYPVDRCIFACPAHVAGRGDTDGAVLLTEIEPGAALAAGFVRRPQAVVCPENAGRLPLMNSEGQGACVTCKLCPQGKRDILFSTSHREDAAVVEVKLTRKPALPATPPAPRPPGRCANPECGAVLPAGNGRGAPRKWCRDQCRWAVYHRSRTNRMVPT